jgi:hypothetical protein
MWSPVVGSSSVYLGVCAGRVGTTMGDKTQEAGLGEATALAVTVEIVA